MITVKSIIIRLENKDKLIRNELYSDFLTHID